MPLEVVEGPEIVHRASEWEDREWFPPGPQLAICLSGGKQRLVDLTDDELLQVAAAARRQTSWAQARELAAIAELAQRRTAAEADGDPDYRILSAHESVTEEVAAALTVTGNTAATLVHLAGQLTGSLAETGAALEAGRIDIAKARVICALTEGLGEGVAERVESAVIEHAPHQTTGQLRRRIKRVVERLAPRRLEERKQEAIAGRRLEVWETLDGTANVSLCDIAAEDAHAIHNKITAVARAMKDDGDRRPLDQIRADLARQLLRGTELPDAVRTLLMQLPDAIPQAEEPADPPRRGSDADLAQVPDSAVPPDALGCEGDLTPQARCSAAAAPGREGQVGPRVRVGPGVGASAEGVGPVGRGGRSARSSAMGVDTQDRVRHAEDLGDDVVAERVATVVRRRLGEVTERARALGRLDGLAFDLERAVRDVRARMAALSDLWCEATSPDPGWHGHTGYRPPAAMRRHVQARHSTCVFPTCNQPSRRCDIDHTVPWGRAGTCPCNLAPLCRRHHRAKQTSGWKLTHVWPGVLVWITPSGSWRIVRPDRQ